MNKDTKNKSKKKRRSAEECRKMWIDWISDMRARGLEPTPEAFKNRDRTKF